MYFYILGFRVFNRMCAQGRSFLGTHTIKCFVSLTAEISNDRTVKFKGPYSFLSYMEVRSKK